MKIPITKPYFGEEERKAVLEPLESGWVVQGPKVAEFERRFAEFCGAKFAIATSSCTTALHLSLWPSASVQVTRFFCPRSRLWRRPMPLNIRGRRPVFCDIDLDTFNIDVAEIERRITQRTKAILPVHLFGLSAADGANSGDCGTARIAGHRGRRLRIRNLLSGKTCREFWNDRLFQFSPEKGHHHRGRGHDHNERS